jgi:acyl-CoA reductase-like NAD-dependent aldehyde dehydrogenase
MIAIYDEREALAAMRSEVRDAISAARAAQHGWAALPAHDRAAKIGAIRPLLAQHAADIAGITGSVGGRPVAEKLVSEVLPLLEACRFLQKNTARILRPRRHGSRGRPLWLQGSSFEVHRKPFGVVLIVGAGNYRLFIPAVQIVHALAAGNAVIVKPAENASAPLAAFVDKILPAAGIPEQLVHLIDESPDAAREAARCGIDKAIFTGSSENGRDFLAELAKHNIPSVMELSGADAVYVREDADVELAAKAIAFGCDLNGGNTCMAPHAIIVHDRITRPLAAALEKQGIRADAIFSVKSDAEALQIASYDEHGLGAAIFSRDEKAAEAFARQLPTGFVTINDIIVPTADPRLPFGGVRGSGFGVTRGAEGLLEMTYPQPIAIRRARFLPHLEKPQRNDAELFAAFARLTHGRGVANRFAALRQLFTAARARMRVTGPTK